MNSQKIGFEEIFGKVFISSGSVGFFGKPWRQQRLYNFIPGFNISGATFKTKTTPLGQRNGFMPLRKDFQTEEYFPKCIRSNFFTCRTLNAVSWSSPGLKTLLAANIWQQTKKPFVISFGAAREKFEDGLEEMKRMVYLLGRELPNFQTNIALEISPQCPNLRHNLAEAPKKTIAYLKIVSELRVHRIVKLNALTPIDDIKRIADSGLCDVLCISQTIPFGAAPERINWNKFFKNGISPLAQFGGGALSGPDLLPLTAECIYRIRVANIDSHITGGGGILTPKDVRILKSAGANSVELGTVVKYRPYRIGSLITEAIKILED